MSDLSGGDLLSQDPGDQSQTGALSVRGLAKSFPGVQALTGVDLDVAPGEIHSLAGGNGSGKSTLIKVIAGVEHGDEGRIRYPSGLEIKASDSSPEIARRGNVYFVHQDLGLFPDLTVAENFALGFGFPLDRGGRVRWRAVRKRAASLIDQFEIATSPTALVRDTSRAVQAQIAIARALQAETEGDRNQGLLILDEPTAALPAHEVELLFASLRRFAAHGRSVLFVSHRLDEVLDLANRVTVLRDGSRIGSYDTGALTETKLAELIAGRAISQTSLRTGTPQTGRALLELSGVDARPLRQIDLSVRSGEVVGVAGLLGSGRSELLRCIYGDLPMQSGTLRVGGEARRFRHPKDAVNAGIAFVPESRAASIFYDLPVYINLTISRLNDRPRALWLSDRAMRKRSRRMISKFGVKTADERSLANVLSGGNQQKLVLGRWLGLEPKVLLLDEPTQGVDVAARRDIYELVRFATDAGMGVMLVASDFEELAQNCDRAVVLSGGRIVDELSGDRLTAHALVEAAYSSQGQGKAAF